MHKVRRLIFLALIFSLFLICQSTPVRPFTISYEDIVDRHGNKWFSFPKEEIPESKELREITNERGMRYPPPRVRIVILKREHELRIYSGETYLKSYLSAFSKGGGISEAKERRGDYRTPEGVYYFVTRSEGEQTKFHIFLGINYPNVKDAIRGYKERLIGLETVRKIINAVLKRATWGVWSSSDRGGLWYTNLGGEIGIHGKNSWHILGDKVWGADWTLGCVALSNSDISEIQEVTEEDKYNVPILILGSITEIEDGGRLENAFRDFLRYPKPHVDRGTLEKLEVPRELKPYLPATPE